jgi:hypothetical protein
VVRTDILHLLAEVESWQCTSPKEYLKDLLPWHQANIYSAEGLCSGNVICYLCCRDRIFWSPWHQTNVSDLNPSNCSFVAEATKLLVFQKQPFHHTLTIKLKFCCLGLMLLFLTSVIYLLSFYPWAVCGSRPIVCITIPTHLCLISFFHLLTLLP